MAPSLSAKVLTSEMMELTKNILKELGFIVTFGHHIFESDFQQSSSIVQRVAEIHDAFLDPQVKAILTVLGGYNCNEVLPYLDYRMIAENPKILCGFSDITVLATSITKKCDFITYSGPHFSSFRMEQA